MKQMAYVKSEHVVSDAIQTAQLAPKYFQDQSLFQEKLVDHVDVRFSIDGQQLRQVQHGQQSRHLQELP
jgi:hypothetical protein